MFRIVKSAFVLLLLFSSSLSCAQSEADSELRSLLDAVFPGTSTVAIEGALSVLNTPGCLNVVSFDIRPSYLIPQSYIYTADPQDPQDRFLDSHALYTSILVTDPNYPDEVFPGKVYLNVLEPDIESQNILPILPHNIAYSPEIAEPRAEVSVAVQRGEWSQTNEQIFSLNPTGEVVFDLQENGLAVERRVAFDFTVFDHGQSLHVRGAIHNVMIPLYRTYGALQEEASSFGALSGIVYAVTDANTISVTESLVEDKVHYTIQLETTAMLNDESAVNPVPATVIFTAAARGDGNNDFGGFDVVASEVLINDRTLTGFTALELPNRYVNLVTHNETLSGTISLIFGDGCGGYLMMDLLFRDILIERDE